MKVRIFYHHTDAGGVVYYANYLMFLEEARTEYFEQCGISMRELIKSGVLFVVAHQDIDYKSPALYGDTLEVTTRICGSGAAKVEFLNEVKNQDGKLIAVARTALVCVERNLKPRQIPQELRIKLKLAAN
ncbi:acyl-CoA thioesterase [bacterium]|nr:MAG: acyl-CoA thioesterase [bacterium]